MWQAGGQLARFVFALLLLQYTSAYGVIETYQFESPEAEQRYQHFTEVLRCPKCQNQNLAGSDSSIAADLRRELAQQIAAGKTDDEIVAFMVSRFGDFVLYDPPLKSNTLFLWLLPGLLLLAGLLLMTWLLRQRAAASAGAAISEVVQPDPSRVPGAGLSHTQAWRLLGASLLAVLLAAVLLYRQLGAGPALTIGELARDFFAEAARSTPGNEQKAQQMARELLVRLQQQGQVAADSESGADLQLLYLQGSLHAYLSEFEQALPFYKAYLMKMPTDERVLTEYVQILYLAAGRQLTERVQFVVERALMLNPHNHEVLSLLAMHYYEQGQYRQAIAYWQKILSGLPADDPSRPLVEQAIAAARKG